MERRLGVSFGLRTAMVRLAGLEPATGKTPADFKPAAYANFATAAPATRLEKHNTPSQTPRNQINIAYDSSA